MEKHEMEAFGLVPVPGKEMPPDSAWVRVSPREGVRVFEQGDHRLLVRVKDTWVEWVLLMWASSDVRGADPTYEVLAEGSGTTGYLREPRHTYFGDDGYVFYVQPALLAWAFGVLGEWFDYEPLKKEGA